MNPYFPNVSGRTLELELRLRALAYDLPEETRCRLYALLSEAHSPLRPTSFALENDVVLVHQEQREIAFPRPLPMVKFSHIIFGYEQWLERKYTLPGFVAIDAGDTVVDCGAYVGGFSLSAAKVAGQLHAFEPEQANFACLTRNLTDHANVMLDQRGLYASSQRMLLNISASSVEHSLLTPDDGDPIELRPIEVVSLRDYCGEKAITQIDFLKIEAEGVEIEVFQGLGDMNPAKLAIDVSPEREGQSPADELGRLLGARGYEIRQRGHVMFGRRSV